jgi:hypothetical protein
MFGLTTRWSLAGTPAKVTKLVGHGPDLIEEFDILAVAEGGGGIDRLTTRGTALSATA